MKVKVQVVIESGEGAQEMVEEVACLTRGELCQEELGLTLAEAKDLLQGTQKTMVAHQLAEEVERQRCCPQCGTRRATKGRHKIVIRSLFGKLSFPSPRLYLCCRQGHDKSSFSPLSELLPERKRTAPELLYLEAKWSSLMSYGLSVELLREVLPLGTEVNTRTLRRQVDQVAERLERELGDEKPQFIDGCQRDWENLPEPHAPMTVGLDGGYVHARDAPSRQEGWFEVIVGKSTPAEGASKCFGFVHRYDTKPKRRVFEVLQSQGMQMNQQVTFLSDGGDTVRSVQLYLNPQAEHLLDWFHITMRLTVMSQMVKGLRSDATLLRDVEKNLERLKWYLWHGNVFRSLQTVEDLVQDVDALEDSPKERKLLKVVREFRSYIRANRHFIPNYGDRYRNGETINTAFVESTVNQVISKRFVKKQQMKWTKRGAHLLLQVRTQVLNDDLRKTFCRWYPGMEQSGADVEQAA